VRILRRLNAETEKICNIKYCSGQFPNNQIQGLEYSYVTYSNARAGDVLGSATDMESDTIFRWSSTRPRNYCRGQSI
jgi:hypothetical protein